MLGLPLIPARVAIDYSVRHFIAERSLVTCRCLPGICGEVASLPIHTTGTAPTPHRERATVHRRLLLLPSRPLSS